MKRIKHMMFMIWMAILGLGFMAAVGQAADVDVFIEGAYTETTLVAEVYADITPAILSYGIKISYPVSLLTLNSAEKNESVWYFGDGTTEGNKPYADPDIQTDGEIIIIGGKIDTGAPTAGVTGQRVLLGKLSFTRTESSMPPSTPLTIDVTYAKTGDYKNFVQTDGTVLDGAGVSFTSDVVELGDANKNGWLEMTDILAVRNYMISGVYSCIADCNQNGWLEMTDILCVRNRF